MEQTPYVILVANDSTFCYHLRREILQAMVHAGCRVSVICQVLDFRQELRSWTQETSQSQTEEPVQLGRPVEDGRRPAEPKTLGRPVEDEEPKPQASFSKAVNDLLFGAHSPAAEDKRDLPLTDQTK